MMIRLQDLMPGRFDQPVHDRLSQGGGIESLRVDLLNAQIVKLPQNRVQVTGDGHLVRPGSGASQNHLFRNARSRLIPGTGQVFAGCISRILPGNRTGSF